MTQPLLITESLTPETSRAVAELYGRALRADDEDELYGAIAEWLPEVVPADRASLTLVTEDMLELEIHGLKGAEGAIPLGQRIPVEGTGPGMAVVLETTQRWTVTGSPERSEAATMREAGLEGMINAPLVVNRQAIGALSVARAGVGYEEHHARLMTDIAALVSVNLERFQALARTRSQLTSLTSHQRRLEHLGQLGRRLSSAVTEDEAFLVLAEVASRVLSLDRLSLAFPDVESDTFCIAALRQNGEAPEGIGAGAVVPMAGTGIAQVVSTKTALYVPDLSASEHPEHQLLAKAGLGSGLSVPIHAHGRVTAVINCAAESVDAYEPEDQMAADAIATVVGETLERIRSSQALVQRDSQLAAIVDDSPLLMMTIDTGSVIVQLSEFGASRLGYEASEICGKPVAWLYPDDQIETVECHLDGLSRQPAGTVASWEAQMVNAQGGRLWVRHTGRRLALDSTPASVIVVCEDVTELLELAEKLEHEATHDPLTGLVNRREFDRSLEALSGLGERSGGCVCFIDVDHFKIVNDTAGHRAGDALLVELAQTLGGLVQPDDLLARLGGDEFAVLLPACTLANAVRVADRLRLAVSDQIFIWENKTFGISLSIGVAIIDLERPDPDDVMGRADTACYTAKREGRNRISVASVDAASDRSTRPDGEWGSRLRAALKDGGLELVCQRIATVDGDDGRDRAELLVRLQDPDGELLPAGLFIPAAERLGIVSEIDKWVVSEAAQLLSGARNHTFDDLDFIAVNLSPQSIESEDFLDYLVNTIATPGLDPTKLLFEITETAALSQFAKALRFIQTVSSIGCRFALDDFGAGFSTFHYLKRLPVDILKIDGSLVTDLASDPIDRSIVRSIVEVADTLGMRTIAEFVESDATIERLRELGVDFAQGYGVGYPREISDGFPKS